MKQTCSTCKWCEKDELEDMICVKDTSEYCADYVDGTHNCEEWEALKDVDNG